MGFPEKLLTKGEHVVVLVRWALRPFVRWCTTTYTFFGRGTLVVSDAGEEGRVPLDDIPDVAEAQRRVAQELHRSTVPGRDDDGT